MSNCSCTLSILSAIILLVYGTKILWNKNKGKDTKKPRTLMRGFLIPRLNIEEVEVLRFHIISL